MCWSLLEFHDHSSAKGAPRACPNIGCELLTLHVLTGVAFGLHYFNYGRSRSLFYATLFSCVISALIGLYVTYHARAKVEVDGFSAQPAKDAFMRNAPHTRLLWGAGDMLIILYLIFYVESDPQRSKAWDIATPFLRE